MCIWGCVEWGCNSAYAKMMLRFMLHSRSQARKKEEGPNSAHYEVV